jgi:hypothetical protein
MLLNVEGLSKAWKDGACSCWEMEIGKFQDKKIPFAVGDWLILRAQRTSVYGITMSRDWIPTPANRSK